MEPTTPSTETSPPSLPRDTSLSARLFNVFASPGEVFDEVDASDHKTVNWLVPALIAAMIGIISSFIIFSQDAVVQKIHEEQSRGIEKQVGQGKITREEGDKVIEDMSRFTRPSMMIVTGSVAAVIGSLLSIFWWALLLWLVQRFAFKVREDFMKSVEVAGLASMIGVLDSIVRTLLIVITGNPAASLSLVLFADQFTLPVKYIGLLAAVNVMSFWILAVRSIGLARLSNVPFGRAAIWVFGIWLVWTLITNAISIAVQSAFGN